MTELLQIEVAYAKPDEQCILQVEVPEGSTLECVIHQSGILKRFPEIDLAKQKVGIFSQVRQLHDTVHAGDRIEIYRDLLSDPKEKRRDRAKAVD